MSSQEIFYAEPEAIHIGNGGDVVVCRSEDGSTIESIQLLDFYEAFHRRRIQIDLGAAELSFQQKIELALSRLDPMDKGRADKYRSWVATFFDEAFMLPEQLNDEPDSRHISMPRVVLNLTTSVLNPIFSVH